MWPGRYSLDNSNDMNPPKPSAFDQRQIASMDLTPL